MIACNTKPAFRTNQSSFYLMFRAITVLQLLGGGDTNQQKALVLVLILHLHNRLNPKKEKSQPKG